MKKVLIVGLGKVTGAAVAEALLDQGLQVRVAEAEMSPSNEQAAAGLAGRGVQVVFDDQDLSMADWADLVVPSPGVPPSHPLLRAALARGAPVWSEIETGWRLAKGPVIAITGTNGKTTTTELLTCLLTAASQSAVSAGNIGFPLAEAARSQGAGTVLVTEVSSFQLAFIDLFRPSIGIVLNVSDDHYDWHEGHDDYLAAKARITENQGPDDLLLVKAEDPGALSIAARSSARIGVFGLEPPGLLNKRVEAGISRRPDLAAGISGEALVISSGAGEAEVMKTSDIRLAGTHNLENVLASAGAAFSRGCSVESMKEALSEFRSLPHRMNVVAEKNGTMYIDDSKATNPHAALAALKGLSNVVLIAGGRSKGIPLDPLRAAVEVCKAAVVMGEAAEELRRVFSGLPVRKAAGVEEAVLEAARMARPGDTVLLSPGCSSLDQYSSYAERGDRFIRAVELLP